MKKLFSFFVLFFLCFYSTLTRAQLFQNSNASCENKNLDCAGAVCTDGDATSITCHTATNTLSLNSDTSVDCVVGWNFYSSGADQSEFVELIK